MSHSQAYTNGFAGISGSVTTERSARVDVRTMELPEANLLLDPTGRWAIRLNTLAPEVSRMLLQMLRDLAPPATQVDSALIRHVAEIDAAALKDTSLVQDIERGMAVLDTLARKLTRRNYVEVEERTLRRTLLSQIGDQPLMDRLGIRQPAHLSHAI